MKPHFSNTSNPIDFPKTDTNMNKLIKELKIQACKWASKNTPMSEYENACDEKFAELIIRECIEQIHGADVGDLKAKAYYLDKVAEHIEKHFGFE